MEAGRELDVKVAEEVMELKPCDKWIDANLGSAGGPCKVHGTFEDPIPWEDCHCYPEGEPGKYSTDIAAAWPVVEKMQRIRYKDDDGHEWFTLVNVYCCPGELNCWHCKISQEWLASGEFYELWSAYTAAEAICLAALNFLIALNLMEKMEKNEDD